MQDATAVAIALAHIDAWSRQDWDRTRDGNGTLYVADGGNGAIRKVVIATRTVTTIVGVLSQHAQVLGPLPGGLVFPETLALDASGALYISDDDAILVAH